MWDFSENQFFLCIIKKMEVFFREVAHFAVIMRSKVEFLIEIVGPQCFFHPVSGKFELVYNRL